MEHMKKLYSTLLLVTLVVTVTVAQQQPFITIHGRVVNQENGTAISGQSVFISIDSLQNQGHYNTVVTDSNGVYADYVPYMSGIEQQAIIAFTYDCQGKMVKNSTYFHPGKLDVIIDLIICSDTNTRCEASFKFSPNPNNPLQVAFYDDSRYLPGSGKINYTWNFGDSTGSTDQFVIHAFTKPDLYTVCLTIKSDDNFCNSTICLPVDVRSILPAPCENNFWYYHDSVANTYGFTGSLLNGEADSWKWDFGDGSTAVGQMVTHTFSNPDTNYTVCLTTSSTGPGGIVCTFTSCQQLFFNIPSSCESSFSYQPDSSGTSFAFTGFAKNNLVSSWQWDFGDGTTSTGQNVTHSFNTSATAVHHVCLTTAGTGPEGVSCIFISCQDIYSVIPVPCQNSFKINPIEGSVYSFSGSVNSGVNALYYWDFGDGTSDTGQVVTHMFGKISTIFNVCLTTVVPVPASTGFYECKSISCQSIFNGVDSSTCKAIVSIVSDSSKNTYHFQNLSQHNYNYAYWDFGDGSLSFEANAFHTYTSPGLYIACLTIGDSLANCRDQSCQEIWVEMIQNGCLASFTALPVDSSNIKAYGFRFYNTSTSGFTKFKWSFGDGNVSTDSSPLHFYSNPGVYNACLTIWDSAGRCQSNYCMDIVAGADTRENTVSGVVKTGNKVADQGIVWLVSPDNKYNAETQIDSLGNYHFNGVPYGKYYIYAMLTPGSTQFFAYMPTYFASSLSWQGATLITTGENNEWYPINLVPSSYWSQGNGVITGTIFWGELILKADSYPAANVELVLYNSNGDPIAYTFTDHEGNFIFEHLPYGDYTLQAEMTGKSTETVVVNLADNQMNVSINFVVSAEEITILGIDKPDKVIPGAGNLYPNPVGETLHLRLKASASGPAVVEIVDVQGHIIYSESVALFGGDTLISINTSMLTKGIYLLRLKAKGQKEVLQRFIK